MAISFNTVHTCKGATPMPVSLPKVPASKSEKVYLVSDSSPPVYTLICHIMLCQELGFDRQIFIWMDEIARFTEY